MVGVVGTTEWVEGEKKVQDGATMSGVSEQLMFIGDYVIQLLRVCVFV